MASIPCLPSRANLADLFTAFPKGAQSLMSLHDDLLRSDSELTIAERELIATYVSSLNACAYCFGAHRTMAEAFGIAVELIDALMNDFEAAPLAEKTKCLLRYAAKVTRRDSILPSDTNAILAAGWSQSVISETLMISALYNMMNRIVDGAGLSTKHSYERPGKDDLERRRNGTYTNWGKTEGFIP
jgi:uncharacterized peroxidase-related enzyme